VQDSSIRLIGIDVDGTLVGSSGIVHPAVWSAAERARELGIHLTLCSGRPAFGTGLAYAKQLDSSGWHIFQNGSSIVHLSSRQSRSVTLPPEHVRELVSRARTTGDTLELYSDSEFVSESASEWAKAHAHLLGVPFAPKPFESLTQPIVRAQWLFTAEQAQVFMAAAHPGLEVAQSTSPLMPDTQFVGITKEGVSKGNALRSVAAEYGVALRDVMYVGDAGNDLSALRIIGHPVAMGNAAAAVIKAATRTVGPVDQGGLAEALALAIATHPAA
jgi:Cof subfamily protein (haloacid dehalogenase superfamily)